MKTKSKALLLALCTVLLVAASVLGTMAYLTSQAQVTNTFTVGSVTITLDEAPVDADGKATTGNRVTANSYKLMPGHTYDKDPTIHVADDSENCWLFVQITDEIAAIQDADTVADQMAENGWTLVAGTDNVYAHKDIAKAGEDVEVFGSFKIKGNVDNATLETYANKTIQIIAYAVQSDGFDTAADAWNAAFAASAQG